MSFLEKAKTSLGLLPAIDFYTQEQDSEEDERNKSKTDKENFRTFNIILDPTDEDDGNTYKTRIKVFRNGGPEEWCRMRTEVRELVRKLKYDDGTADENSEKATHLYQAVLEGKALSKFKEALTTHTALAPARKLQMSLNDVVRTIFPNPEEAYSAQKRYLTKGALVMGANRPSVFARRLETLNGYLKYFPRRTMANGALRTNNVMPDDQLMDILDMARDYRITKLMVGHKDRMSNYDNLTTFVQGLESWFDAAEMQDGLLQKQEQTGKSKRKRQDEEPSLSKRTKNSKDRTAPCKHCNKMHNAPDHACWTLKKKGDSKSNKTLRNVSLILLNSKRRWNRK